MTPVILLDIDGVINAIARRGDKSVWPAEAWATGLAHGGDREWPILWARPVVDFITEVHGSGRAEIRWHTTWQEHAANLAALVGLPFFPVADLGADPFGSSCRWWKLHAAEQVVYGEGRRLAWIDDDLFHGRLVDVEAVRSLARNGSVCTVAPRPHVGLTPANLAQISKFLGGAA